MGYSLAWVAVRGDRKLVHESLGIRPTGTREEIPESAISGAELPGGWTLVVSNRDGLGLSDDATLARLSQLGDLVFCSVEEHVMCSIAAGWRDGRELWSVTRDSQSGRDHLEVVGEPPESFAATREMLRSLHAVAEAEGEPVDYLFDIPVSLARTLTGYRHDEDAAHLPDLAFEVLTPIAQDRPWWKRWLRR